MKLVMSGAIGVMRLPGDQGLGGACDVGHEIRRGFHIPVGMPDVRVAEIGSEGDEVARNIVTAHRALLQNARREGVTQIMDTRTPRSILTDARLAQDHAEVAMDGSMPHRLGIDRQEHMVVHPGKNHRRTLR